MKDVDKDYLEYKKVILFEVITKLNNSVKKKQRNLDELNKNKKVLENFLINNKQAYNLALLYIIGKGEYGIYQEEYFRLENELKEFNSIYEEESSKKTEKKEKMHSDLEKIYIEDIIEALKKVEEIEFKNVEFIDFYNYVYKEHSNLKGKIRKIEKNLHLIDNDKKKVLKKIKKIDKKIN